MNNLPTKKMKFKLFNFNGHNIRIIDNDGNPWFIATDVCEILGLKNTSISVKGLNENERSKFNLGRYKNNFLNIINESGLYKLVLKSRKHEAIKFQDWITSEVLPSIRKTGSYNVNKVSTDLEKKRMTQQVIMFLSEDIEELKIKNNILLEKNEVQTKEIKEKDTTINLLSSTKKHYITSEIAKELGFRSAIAFNKKLYADGIQYKRNGTWMLSAKYTGCEYEYMKQTIMNYSDGSSFTVYSLMWTQKGREFLLKEYKK